MRLPRFPPLFPALALLLATVVVDAQKRLLSRANGRER